MTNDDSLVNEKAKITLEKWFEAWLTVRLKAKRICRAGAMDEFHQ